MKIIHKEQTKKVSNSENCIVFEYSLGDKDINGSIVELTGRYPSNGRVVNLKCKELCYIIKGSGKIVIENQEFVLHEGDLVSIDPGEKFFWDGNLIMFVSCAPAWHSEQHKEVD
jgi:mannose-6-phosphate isomerase-like protein (cupin superfamily)